MAEHDKMSRSIAAHGLPLAGAHFPPESLDDLRWAALLAGAQANRMSGILVQAIVDGALRATDDQRGEAIEAYIESVGTVLRLERTLLWTIEHLDRAGIDYRILKGAAVAHLVYPDPGWRAYGDLDVLVPSDLFDRAVAVLVAAGGHRHEPQVRPGFDRRFGKGTAIVTEEKHEIDLHRTFAAGLFGLNIKTDDLFATSSAFTVGGETIRALGPEERFLHACYSAAIGDPSPRLMTLRDIAQMLLLGEIDAQRVRTLCDDWRGRAVVDRAIRSTQSTFGLDELPPEWRWTIEHRCTSAEVRALRSYTSERSGGSQALGALGAIRGVRAKLAFLRAMALPQRSFLDRKSNRKNLLRWWGKGARSLRRSFSRPG